MKFYCGEDYEAMSRIAANIISAQIIMKPDCVLGLATGSSPEGTYAQLVEWYKKGDLDFSQVTSVNLDEYRGLSGDNDQSYRYFMNTHLFDHVNIHPIQYNLLFSSYFFLSSFIFNIPHFYLNIVIFFLFYSKIIYIIFLGGSYEKINFFISMFI